MTPNPPQGPEPASSAGDGTLASSAGDGTLEQATQSLREHVDLRWVEISDRVLARALRASRTSLPMQAVAASGPVHISEQVLIAYLREAVSSVPDAKVLDIHLRVEGIDTYAGVTITVSARYGTPLIPMADTIRNLATERLTQLLGPITPPVTVTTMVVHVADVFREDVGPTF